MQRPMIDQGRNSPVVFLLRGFLLLLMKILFRIEHHGLECVPPDGPLLLVCNHVTYFDPFWVATPVRRAIRFMAWDKIFKIPVAGAIFRWLGAFPISLENPESSAFKTALRVLGRSEALVIFPEGGRSPDGRLLPFKEGAARLALRCGATVLPVVILGGERVWSPRMRLPRPAKVIVKYLGQIPPDKMESSPELLNRRIRSLIEMHILGQSNPRDGI